MKTSIYLFFAVFCLACGGSGVAVNSGTNTSPAANSVNSSSLDNSKRELIEEQQKLKKDLDEMQKNVNAAVNSQKDLEKRIDNTKKQIEETKKKVDQVQ